LEEEYLFIDVMSTFLRAIRAGAIHIRHGAILLAHYGRLGPAFDICSKVIVDVLRDEGMINKNGEIVVSVLTQALEEVCGSFSSPCDNGGLNLGFCLV
jgi:cohesin complex subunit SA-1/2